MKRQNWSILALAVTLAFAFSYIFLDGKHKLGIIPNFPARLVKSVRSTNIHIATESGDPNFKNFIYFSSYILENQLYLLGLRGCADKSQLNVQLKSSFDSEIIKKKVQIRSMYNQCPWQYFPTCQWQSFFFITPVGELINETLLEFRNEQPINLDIKRDKEHYLVICLSPLFYFVDWTLFIQFVEIWMQLGATKIFVYIHSITPEVENLLEIYIKDGIIEKYDYPKVPKYGYTDPNEFLHYTELVFVTNECLLRARPQARYVAFIDMDEFMIPEKHKTVPKMLEEFEEEHKNLGATLYDCVFVQSNTPSHMEDNDTYSPISITLKSITFDHLSSALLLERHGMGYRLKTIAKPESIRRMSIHHPFEMSPGYSRYQVPLNRASIYHIRRVGAHDLKTNKTSPQKLLGPYAKLATEAFQKRLKKYKMTEMKFIYRGMKVIEKMEKCSQILFQDNKRSCPAPVLCQNNITAVKKNEWVFAENVWITV